MSVNIYLDAEKLKQVEGFVEPNKEGLIKFRGYTLFPDGNRYYLISSPESSVPYFLADAVDEISLYEFVPAYVPREKGVYRHKSARAEIDLTDQGSGGKEKPTFWIRLTCKDSADAKELIHLFRTGAIRPDESFETPQGGPSYAELKAKAEQFDKMERKLAEVVERSCKVREELEKVDVEGHILRTGLQQVINNIRPRPWPLCWRKNIAQKLQALLVATE